MALNDALRTVGLNFEGTEHSGIDDAKNTARLAYKLAQHTTLRINSSSD